MKAIAPVAPAAPVAVELIDGQPTTTSLDVAAHFGKLHKDVLRAVRSLECSPEFHERNFAPIQIDVDLGMGRSRKDQAFRMTRDGFTFLCMGFTGKEAAKWKEAYINAFNQLEQAVHQPLAIAQDVKVEQRALRGRHVLIAHFDGQPWFAAGNLCSALDLGSSDRIIRSLPDHHKRKLQRGTRELWMVDADGARRAADYCKPETATEYRQWLQRILAEFTGGTERHLAWAGESDVLSNVPVEIEQLLGQKLRDMRFMVYFEFNGEMRIKAIDPGTTLLRRDRLATYIGDPEGAPRSTLPDILEAVSRRMKSPH
ncbi:TPA: Rha family transcriptional regulator [Pseudomonas aeruginosa]|nr:Rha family transcriptional regulator [Pseudomonas aeruginosa]